MDLAALRILDANANRAREALRVMEEYARFVLDDVGLSSALKQLRHDLADTLRGFEPSGSLIAHRDIVGDVGCEIRTDSEFDRADMAAVVLAAGKRLSESLRVIEEYGKTVEGRLAMGVQRLRYRGYEIERRLNATLTARKRFAGVRLYVIIAEALCRGDWYATAQAALRGGADCLQLREKSLSDRDLLVRATRLAQLCGEHGARFIVNDRPDVAAAAGADGVHLGQDDLPVAAVRSVLPSRCVIGVSTHSVPQIETAAAAAPDYVAVGPMYNTPTKPQEHIAGPETLAAAHARTSLPLVAIGGIDESSAGAVLAAAPAALCVCRAVVAQDDPAAAAARLRRIVDEARACSGSGPCD